MAKTYQTNLRKFVDSLSDHQVLCLGAELDHGGLERLQSLLLERLEGIDEGRLALARVRHQQLFADLIRVT